MNAIIGIDPGPVTGMCLLRLPTGRDDRWYAELVQASPNAIDAVIGGWFEAQNVLGIAAEAFVTGPRAARLGTPGGAQDARDVLARLRPGDRRNWRARWIERRATDVKPWATDARLHSVGLLVPSKAMKHARDAVRHALFAACHDFGARVPRIITGGPLDATGVGNDE